MAGYISPILLSIREKAAALADRNLELTRINREQAAQIADLKAEIGRLDAEMKALKTDNDFLSVSHRLAASPDEIVKSRRLIEGWIREIDRCIARIRE